MSDLIIASDGLPARKAGAWARPKLDFLDGFVPSALRATQRKHDRVFLDLFAGPGLNVIASSGLEFPGSPMRVATLTAPGAPSVAFTRAIFCNVEPVEHDAVRERIARLVAAGGCRIPQMEPLLCDTNAVVGDVLATINPHAYILAFADIEGVQQLPWTTIAALRARHGSVDLYVLVPVELSFNRLLGPRAAHRERNAPVLDAYFGHQRWRPIADRWRTKAQGPAIRRELLDLYLEGLRGLWRAANVVEVGRYGGRRLLYRMTFATSHDAAVRISRWASSRPREAQGRLDLG